MAHLFTDIDQLRTVVPSIRKGTHPDSIFPYIDDAAEQYMINYISREYYEELVTEHAADNISANNAKVFTLLQKALGHYAIYDAYPDLNLQIGNSGVAENTNQNTSQTRQWVYKDSRKQKIIKADRFLDNALAIMEATPNNYQTWRDSDAYTEYSQYFFTNATEFSKELSINNSRRTFLALVPWIRLVEDSYIRTTLGDTLMDDLKNTSPTGVYKPKVLQLVKKTLAFYAIYSGSNHLKLNVSSESITLVSTSDGIESRTSADAGSYHNWRMEIKGYAESYNAELKKYLDDNKENISQYESDDASSTNNPRYTFPDNSGKKSVMV